MNNNKEKWVKINDFPYYEISSHGRIKSLSRIVYRRNRKMILKEKILKLRVREKDGLCSINLYTNQIDKKTLLVHRLVAEHFLPFEKDKENKIVCHKDKNLTNNHYENLFWSTLKQEKIKSANDRINKINYQIKSLDKGLIKKSIEIPLEEKEIWANIPNFEFYQCSTFGRIRSISHQTLSTNGKLYNISGQILSQFIVNGYKYVGIKGSVFRVHRIIALTFINNFKNNNQVHHIDGNKLNNYHKNLIWIDPKNHCIETRKTKGNWNARGDQLSSSIISQKEAKQIRKLYATGQYTQKELGEMFGLKQSYHIIHHQSWNY